jgi:hypothetical protein
MSLLQGRVVSTALGSDQADELKNEFNCQGEQCPLLFCFFSRYSRREQKQRVRRM